MFQVYLASGGGGSNSGPPIDPPGSSVPGLGAARPLLLVMLTVTGLLLLRRRASPGDGSASLMIYDREGKFDERGYGREAVLKVFNETLDAKTSPAGGHVISLWISTQPGRRSRR